MIYKATKLDISIYLHFPLWRSLLPSHCTMALSLVDIGATNVVFMLTIWCFVCFGPGIVESQEYEQTTQTPRPSLDQLRQKAAVQCSYRYSNNIHNVSETQCRNCVSLWSGTTEQLSEEVDKLVYRMTFDCRPLRNLKEQLRKLCRSSSLPERRSLQAYVDCDDCLERNGVKDVGTTFDEVINARKQCIRVGHKITVLTSSFGGRIYKDYKYHYDYELLRETFRDGCKEHFSEQTVSTCNLCFDNLFLWPDYPADQASKKLRSCLPDLSYKEAMARPCRFLNHPVYKSLFMPVGFEQCRTCFQEANIPQNSSRDEQLVISYTCLPPANPRKELQLQLCSKIDKDLPFWKQATQEQPRNLCFEWATTQNLSAGSGYVQYKAAHQDISHKFSNLEDASHRRNRGYTSVPLAEGLFEEAHTDVMNYLLRTCSGDYEASEKCKGCIELALSKIASSPSTVTREDFVAAFRCLLANRNQNPFQLDDIPATVPPPDNSAIGSSAVPNLDNGGQTGDTGGGPAIRIASDSR